MFEVIGDGVREGREAPERTGQRLCRDRAALVSLRGEARYALQERTCLFARESAHARPDVALTDHDQVHRSLRAWCARQAEEPLGVGNDRRPILLIGWDAVQHHHERETTLAHAAQHLPRHQVCVARRGRDKHAEIARFHQHVGELSVVALDGVDVGRIDDGNAIRACGRCRQLQPLFRDAGETAAREDSMGIALARV